MAGAPVDEQIRIYEALHEAKKRVALESTATPVRDGTENRNGAADDTSGEPQN